MNIWHNTKRSLPPIGKAVLVCYGKDVALAKLFLICADGSPLWSYTGLPGAPTHWMPLPTTPKED